MKALGPYQLVVCNDDVHGESTETRLLVKTARIRKYVPALDLANETQKQYREHTRALNETS